MTILAKMVPWMEADEIVTTMVQEDIVPDYRHQKAKSLLDKLPASDKSFSRLLSEAPSLTDSVMRLLENLCCPDGPDAGGKDTRDDRITQGLGAVWSLILGRPQNRQACLTLALKVLC
ncbi:hypothetical protein RND81_04G197900 [Saponaria officinalis]|uniref:Uncharacterized protein n=1 Tax=Saponaria officinalis TaxID=3572 RepID=A0AAW1LFE0_SAPOF